MSRSDIPPENKSLGLSGRLTKATLTSPLTPLFLIVAILVGLLAVISIPREEEPQISVPMIDISVAAPGMKAVDAEQLIAKPLETIVKSVNDVDHVYSFIDDDHVLVTARFKVGTDPDNAAIRIHEKLSANMDRLPVGIAAPLVQTRGINDVPAMIITLSPKPGSGDALNDTALYNMATKLRTELSKVDNVGLTFIVGGRPEEIRIEPNAANMAARGVALDTLINTIKGANTRFPGGMIRQQGQAVSVGAGQTIQTATDVGLITVPSVTGQNVLVRDVATVIQAPREEQSHVFRYTHIKEGVWRQTPAVSLAIAKRKGANAVVLSHAVLERVDSLKGSLIPSNVQVSVTRDYGESANEKANELLFHLGLATVSIVILIGFAIGWREAGVTAVVIPTTILLTMFASNLMGYTINRVSLFALIFSIGILVDDAIVMIENISRHWGMPDVGTKDGRNHFTATVDAVAEVGNPTVIATLTVVAALLPMLFVSGLMGPYMAPIPVNASAAMIFSFFVAVILAPWLMIRFARKTLKTGEQGAHSHDREGVIGVIYRRVAASIIKDKKSAGRFLAGVGVATLVSCAMFATKTVTVKLLPFDNKSELQVIADLPKGTSLEATQRILNQAAQITTQMKEVEAIDAYAGTATPFNFNGLVRHYYFRTNPEQGDLNVLLAPKDKRSRASHAIAIDLRNRLKAIPLPANGVLKVVEAPPGPPVMATLLAEVYGPDAATRRTVAEKVKAIYKSIPYIVDVDDSYGVPAPKLSIVANRQRLEALNVSDGQVYASVNALMNGQVLGYSDRGDGRDPLEIALRIPQTERTFGQALQAMPVATSTGVSGPRLVSLGEVTTATQTTASTHIFRRDGRDVDMIMGEMAGQYEAPIYGLLAVDKAIKSADWGKLPTPAIRLNGQPTDESKATVLWDGEWEITWVTFRDMGAAFGVALLGIYVLVVGQFKSFKLPLVILTPVPLTLIGIVIGHILFRAPFTATSMIGFIALAGIIVRNSILLVDFIRHADKYDAEGNKRPLQDILLDAGATRFKPILLTALAAMIGASVILTDPIFQGLAISLLFGLLSSTLLTVLVIPAIYVVMRGGQGSKGKVS
ncbi:multidrug transporter AcrB [Asticcacaulis sp. AC466]|uniref:efflux RND transporter permease subunit n=1 Tax=Asticcacaulis sp. AC466 TaxID=1282362 RepID=UPI0003C3CA70|nr:efflux RND transporter permease subunit [Asticcacaulis sp. AC466]ESQ84733.1 multidrug transporter AcrB [Asticcacaulis sp. AC466]